jgi:hypothetical protein
MRLMTMLGTRTSTAASVLSSPSANTDAGSAAKCTTLARECRGVLPASMPLRTARCGVSSLSSPVATGAAPPAKPAENFSGVAATVSGASAKDTLRVLARLLVRAVDIETSEARGASVLAAGCRCCSEGTGCAARTLPVGSAGSWLA